MWALVGASALAWGLKIFVKPQPARWRFVWLSVFLTGLPTLGWHGFPSRTWHILDVGSNLLVAWAVQNAVLGDYHSPALRRVMIRVSGAVNALAVLAMIAQSFGDALGDSVSFGAFGGYHWGELVLIADSFVVVGLFWSARARIPERAAALLRVTLLTFLVGLGLSTAKGTTVHLTVLSYHATWHVVSAFGFIFLWAYNHVRLVEIEAADDPRDPHRSHA